MITMVKIVVGIFKAVFVFFGGLFYGICFKHNKF